jgi:ADP-ribose pyrophosphatase YjhB (NUDIX family)
LVDILPQIRNTPRALILRDENLLLQYKTGYDDGSEKYVLPGGAQDPGETLENALSRECFEEIGVHVNIAALMYVAEYFKPRDAMPQFVRQQVDFIFSCTVPEDYIAANGPRPDKHQVDVVWVPRQQLREIALYPNSLADYLVDPDRGEKKIYLGQIS